MIIFIDTTSQNTRLIFDEQFIQFTAEKQAIAMPARVREILSNGVTPTAIGVMTGPGSFTGIRLGIAYAKGLAMGYKIPLIGVNLFDFSLAHIAAINSGRGDFYVRQNAKFEILDVLPSDATLIECYEPADAISLVKKKLNSGHIDEVMPLYIRPSYAEKDK